MAELLRKKNKANRLVAPEVRLELVGPPLLLRTTHPKHPGELDMTEFAVGAIDTSRRELHPTWNGGFSGRPRLINELAPEIKKIHANSTELTCVSVCSALRTWWRLLDSWEGHGRVESVADINDIHGALQMRENVSADYTNTFLRLVNAARLTIGLPPLFWTKSDRPDDLTELPEPAHIKRIYHELKQRVFRVFHRWERADLLAVDGQDWTGRYDQLIHNRPWVEPDEPVRFFV